MSTELTSNAANENKNGSEISGMLKDAVILFVITMVSGLLLGLVYSVTENPIKVQEELAKTRANQAVFADAASFEDVQGFDEAAATKLVEADCNTSINMAYAAKDGSGKVLGYVVSVSAHGGYGGDISFSVGIRNDGTMNGMSILSISETPGLGMRAEEVLVPQVAPGKTAPLNLVKNTKPEAAGAGEIAAISGASITSTAVTNGLNAAFMYFDEVLSGMDSDATSGEGGN